MLSSFNNEARYLWRALGLQGICLHTAGHRAPSLQAGGLASPPSASRTRSLGGGDPPFPGQPPAASGERSWPLGPDATPGKSLTRRQELHRGRHKAWRGTRGRHAPTWCTLVLASDSHPRGLGGKPGAPGRCFCDGETSPLEMSLGQSSGRSFRLVVSLIL